MERIVIDDEFKNWLIAQLPLGLILDAWHDYNLPSEITEEEIRSFERFLRKKK